MGSRSRHPQLKKKKKKKKKKGKRPQVFSGIKEIDQIQLISKVGLKVAGRCRKFFKEKEENDCANQLILTDGMRNRYFLWTKIDGAVGKIKTKSRTTFAIFANEPNIREFLLY